VLRAVLSASGYFDLLRCAKDGAAMLKCELNALRLDLWLTEAECNPCRQ
jgi:hypothetical protein